LLKEKERLTPYEEKEAKGIHFYKPKDKKEKEKYKKQNLITPKIIIEDIIAREGNGSSDKFISGHNNYEILKRSEQLLTQFQPLTIAEQLITDFESLYDPQILGAEEAREGGNL